MACEVRGKVTATVTGNGTVQDAAGGGPAVTVSIPPINVEMFNDLNQPPANMQKVDSTHQNTVQDGPLRMNGTAGINIPGFLNVQVNFNLNVFATLEYDFDFYASPDCHPPHCVEGVIHPQRLQVDLVQVAGPDAVLGTVNFNFGNRALEFGNCFTPPWKNCCPVAERRVIALPPQTSPIVTNLVEAHLQGSATIEYMIYHQTGQFVRRQRQRPQAKQQRRARAARRS